MKALRVGVALLAMAVASIALTTRVQADGGLDQAAQRCPQYGGWLLYRLPAGGSGGIASLYTGSHGDCVAFFAQHPDYQLVAVTAPNPPPA